MKLQNFFGLSVLTLAVMFIGVSCTTKEGAPGPKGDQGDPGTNGLDATEACKQCHNPTVVDAKAVEFNFSKHEYGEAAFEESGNQGCSPCHTQLGFLDVIKRNVSTVFVKDATTGKYSNPYMASTSSDIGELSCFTCHSQLHTSYTYADMPVFATTAAVPMTMWGGAKTINLTQDGGKSNLCIKCHQPRPFTNSNTDGNVLNYGGLVSNPTAIFFDPNATTGNVLKPGYRTHTHYGTVGAIYAGIGGVEFPGSYGQMIHASKASCEDCHMAPMTNRAGGHSFFAKGNFNGCNVTDCHALTPVSTTNAKYWVNPRATVKALLEQLAAKLKYNGIEIMNKNPDTESNLWVGLTTNKYDGYLNIYDPVNNPNGLTNNAGTFQSPSPSSSWTADQKATNLALPKLTLTNAQMGAIINFQLCLREYSLGIHNLDYSKALLTNSIAILP
jgi:hypothetical protein